MSPFWSRICLQTSQPKRGQPRVLRLGLFHGVPMTQKSVFGLPGGPDYVVLYQKNIEAVCATEAEVRHQIRQTVIHEIGHYFGMTEEQLKDVRVVFSKFVPRPDGRIDRMNRRSFCSD